MQHLKHNLGMRRVPLIFSFICAKWVGENGLYKYVLLFKFGAPVDYKVPHWPQNKFKQNHKSNNSSWMYI